MVDLLIRQGTLVTESDAFPADLAIQDGRIAAVLEPGEPCAAEAEISARGLHVMPGMIDGHVHFNEPGRTEWEGFETGSRAAAAGGVTTFLDMPLNCLPPTLDRVALETKRGVVAGKSVIDFGFWGGLVDDNTAELAGLHEAGVVAFKAFMCESGVAEYPRADEGLLFDGMRRLGPLGGLLGLHAESHELTGDLASRLEVAGRRDPWAWAESRPPLSESTAATVALRLASATGCQVHFVHVSTPETVALVAEARQRGVGASVETCPHYLALDEDDLARLGSIAKCAPPLRSRALVEELWRCVLGGTIDFVASDHSPSTVAEKYPGANDIWRVWGGISGVQTTLSILLTEGVHRRGLTLPKLVRLVSGNPARRFRLAPRKGSLQPGADADLILIDLYEEWELCEADLFTRNKLSPFLGRRFKGRAHQTLVRGQTVYRAGEIVGPSGFGREVRVQR